MIAIIAQFFFETLTPLGSGFSILTLNMTSLTSLLSEPYPSSSCLPPVLGPSMLLSLSLTRLIGTTLVISPLSKTTFSHFGK